MCSKKGVIQVYDSEQGQELMFHSQNHVLLYKNQKSVKI